MKDVQDSAAVIAPEAPGDDAEVTGLVDRTFGPGRFAKAAERLREFNPHPPAIALTARETGRLVGTVRLWPVWIGARPALLLGPIAVDPAARHRGLGAALVEQACTAARDAGHEAVVLVGDLSFFQRLGFEPVPPGRIRMPGPADPLRILVRALSPGALEGLEGEVSLP